MSGQPMEIAIGPPLFQPCAKVVKQPARIEIIEKEIAKLEKPLQLRWSSCLYPSSAKRRSSSVMFGKIFLLEPFNVLRLKERRKLIGRGSRPLFLGKVCLIRCNLSHKCEGCTTRVATDWYRKKSIFCIICGRFAPQGSMPLCADLWVLSRMQRPLFPK